MQVLPDFKGFEWDAAVAIKTGAGITWLGGNARSSTLTNRYSSFPTRNIQVRGSFLRTGDHEPGAPAPRRLHATQEEDSHNFRS